MKKSSLETIVLILGIGIIGFALFMYLVAEPTGESAFYTNMVFALGFLIYILYSMMSTKKLNAEIRGLNNHVKSLKDTIQEKDQFINKLEKRQSELIEENQALNKSLSESQATISTLNLKIKELEDLQSTSEESNGEN
mgnify:CR=1 FL=1|tara:strand:+ start:197 stop:610 length:414 start_codon:yes stop_codon:yes gene_type:complete